MKSTIKIDNDEFLMPCIRVKVSQDHDDLRDKMLKQFFEKQGYDQSLLRLQYIPCNDPTSLEYLISPLFSDRPAGYYSVYKHMKINCDGKLYTCVCVDDEFAVFAPWTDNIKNDPKCTGKTTFKDMLCVDPTYTSVPDKEDHYITKFGFEFKRA